MKNLLKFIKTQNKFYLIGSYLIMIGLLSVIPKIITMHYMSFPAEFHVDLTSLIGVLGLLSLSSGTMLVANFKNIYD